jgi:hypothetical protein
MNRSLSLKAVGNATSVFLAVSFAACVGFDLLFPQHAMYRGWQHLLPGFEWISWRSFVLGLIESYGYGWYVALVRVPLYNLFSGHRRGLSQ